MAVPSLAIGSTLRVRYRNHRGVTAERNVRVISAPVWTPVWTSSEYHPEPQWLVWVVDVDTDDNRLFALRV